MPEFKNPFRPGAGHMPPYLAGRDDEIAQFRQLLRQTTILDNMLLTGLRGVGKTVLLETLRPVAISEKWLWVGADLSESASVDEVTTSVRLMTDLSAVTSNFVIETEAVSHMGFAPGSPRVEHRLTYEMLAALFDRTPGLIADKLKAVLEFVWSILSSKQFSGMIFAYDEAQNMSDHPAKDQYPLSLLLDVFQSIQKKGIPFMLALSGLPTLFPKLVEARTFTERMFHIVFLDRLSDAASRDAILKPIQDEGAIPLADEYVSLIVEASGGYPYFIQFICREVYDATLQKLDVGDELSVPMQGVIRKLDTNFFAGRWARATDRQRDLLLVIATLDNCDEEFTVQEVVEKSREVLPKPFGTSQVSQMLAKLSDAGLVYKNRHGKYSFAVPLFGQFILRQERELKGR